MLLRSFTAGLLAAAFTLVAFAGPAYTDPSKADADFALQGEYTGSLKTEEGEVKIGLQVIARGKGKFTGVGYMGGLPGDGWDKISKVTTEGTAVDGTLKLANDEAEAVIKDGVAQVTTKSGEALGTLKKVERASPTIGAKAPEGAVVLFDGSSADKFQGGKVDGELLVQGCTSKQNFGSFKIHLEFRTPYMPEDSGQGRGNSGLYLQGRYELQVLDSFGLKGEQNECGGLYSVKTPDLNMCLPPLAWQTYDIDYTAAKYDADGKLTANPRVSAKLNGVTIHENVELPGERNTTAAPTKAGPEPGPVYLQDHGNPVRYRNIWVVETK